LTPSADAHPGSPARALAISSAGIITCDRLPALERGLSSYLENARRHGRRCDFVVVDDSPGAETRQACRRLLRRLGDRWEAPILYAGLEEKARFARELGALTGVPSEVIRFALFDVEGFGLATVGANMNALLLHTAGQALFAADDDTVCVVGLPPDSTAGTALAADEPWSSCHPYDVRTFGEGEDVLQAAAVVDVDTIGLHEGVLGRCHAALPGRERRVRVSLNGLMGDCGWGSPSSYFFLTGEGRRRWLASEETYRAVCRRREMLRTVPRLTLATSSRNMMTPFFGLDNRELAPPFLPVARGSDHVFGLSLSLCFPDALFAHLPFALLHRPLDPRCFWAGEITRSAAGIDVARLAAALLSSCQVSPPGEDPAVNLRALGQRLEEAASLPLPGFRQLLRQQAAVEQEERLAWLERQLDERAGRPAWWAADVRRFASCARESAALSESAIPVDLLYAHPALRALQLTQRLFVLFGRLLRAWPALVEGARALRGRGRSLALAV
jgi:hypothetical protein